MVQKGPVQPGRLPQGLCPLPCWDLDGHHLEACVAQRGGGGRAIEAVHLRVRDDHGPPCEWELAAEGSQAFQQPAADEDLVTPVAERDGDRGSGLHRPVPIVPTVSRRKCRTIRSTTSSTSESLVSTERSACAYALARCSSNSTIRASRSGACNRGRWASAPIRPRMIVGSAQRHTMTAPLLRFRTFSGSSTAPPPVAITQSR